MKVAIIGAGLSGLACSHELKRHGIIPTIFEKKGYIGEILELPAIELDIFSTAVKNPIKYLKKKFGIEIIPHYEINEIVMVSPTNTHVIKGKMGNIFLRGRDKGTLTIQLKEAVDLSFTANTLVKVEDIKNDFDHIFIGTGTLEIPMQMNLATVHFDAQVRIATVLGDFSTNSVKLWMNTKYAKHGYAYLVPSNSKSASIVLIVDNIKENELDIYWNEFLTTENITYAIIEIKDIHHIVGAVNPVQVDNLYFMGNAGGFLDSMLGFGTIEAMISGATAANCVINGLDYNKAMKKFTKAVMAKYEFRKVFNTFDNDAMDKFCTLETLPVIKQFIFDNPLLKATYGAVFAKVYNGIVESNPENVIQEIGSQNISCKKKVY